MSGPTSNAKRGRRRPPHLRRRAPLRNPKAKIVIVSEGGLTEPQYFGALARHYGAYTVVDLNLVKAAGVPLSVVKKARQLIRKSRNEFSSRDQMWVVFDRDAHPNFDQAISEAEAAGISVAFSNPCFELWIVLHYRDHDAPAERAEIQRTLRELMPTYDPGRSKRIDFAAICNGVEPAEERAEVMERRRSEEGNRRGNPCSMVYKLTREIRSRR